MFFYDSYDIMIETDQKLQKGFWFVYGTKGRISRFTFVKTFMLYILFILILVGMKYYSLENPSTDTIGIIIGYIPTIARPFVYWFFIAQGIKRCHDIGKSGWWFIIPLYFIWLLFAKGDELDNEYGEVPQ